MTSDRHSIACTRFQVWVVEVWEFLLSSTGGPTLLLFHGLTKYDKEMTICLSYLDTLDKSMWRSTMSGHLLFGESGEEVMSAFKVQVVENKSRTDPATSL